MTLKTLNEMLTDNPNLLNFVSVPDTALDLDADTLKQVIIRRCGDVTPYYQTPTEFQSFGALWFETHNFLFAHVIKILDADYNPLENYDRTETETITDSNTGTRSGTDTHSGTDTNSRTHGGTTAVTGSASRENQIAGFDSADYSDANSETETNSETTTHGETITDAMQHGEQIARSEQSSEDNERERNTRIHGNIGVTTSQQMLESEMQIANRFWAYDYIASAFESDNFLTCYNDYFAE